MNTYKPPLTYKNSPIKKLSTAGGKLASAAASRGSAMLDSAREGARSAAAAPSSVGAAAPQGKNEGDGVARKDRGRRSGAGIRDRIHKFDTASRRCRADSAPARPLRADEEKRRSPRNPSRRPPDVETVPPAEREKENSPHPENNVTNRKCTTKTKPIRKLKETFSPAVAKANNEVKRFQSTGNEMKQRFQDTFSKHDDGPKQTFGEAAKQAFRTPAKGTPPKDRDADIVSSSDNSTTDNNNEEELRERLQRLERENEKLERRNASLENKCELLERERSRLRSAKPPPGAKKAAKKRRSEEHPLISSPLRLHARAVHEASESNSFVSVRKDPFPLFSTENPDAARDNGAGTGEGARHLDVLVALTGQCTEEAVAAAGAARRRGGKGEKRKNEEALDLLNSAAILFKNSRRHRFL